MLLPLLLSLSTAGAVFAWGPAGHEWLSGIAIEKLPDGLPAFVRAPAAVAEIALRGGEPNRWISADDRRGAERDPGHHVDIADDGSVMGVLPLGQLPMNREEYDALLRAKGFTQYKTGYLPYSIVDGWHLLRRDFAYWRTDVKGFETAANARERAWLDADRKLREKLTLRDIGIWSHYVGDASQPLHVTVHFDGWGKFANPGGYTTKPVQADFESAFVKRNLSRAAIADQVAPYTNCFCSIEQHTEALLRATLAEVAPLYALDKQGGFALGDPRGVAFATRRLAAGAAVLRDLIVDAWLDSANVDVGYPPVKVRDIESGKVRVTPDLFGSD